MNRDKIEKERILKRNEKHKKEVVIDNLITDIKYEKNDKQYLRKTDADYENYKHREKQKLNEYIKIENRRKENLKRDENRWKKEEKAIQDEIERTKKLQQMPFKSEKNKSKCNTDIINHSYKNYEDSIKEENKKNMFIQNRRQYLGSKINGGYNPITGEKNN